MISKDKAALAPDFSVEDSDGRTIRLADFKGKKNVVLVFNRGFT
jgi:peroxiredoxin